MKDDTCKRAIQRREKKARDMLESVDKTEKFLARLERKLKRVPGIGKYLSIIPAYISLIRAYVKKEYREIPYMSLVFIVGGLIYFLSPLDIIPDIIPFVGYIDDAAVLKYIFGAMKDDVDEYKEWQHRR